MKHLRFAISVVVVVACTDRRNTVPPEQSSQKFADDLGLKVQGKPNCTGIDTDNDGYVTCTLNTGDGRITSIQCAAVNDGDGCNGHSTTYAVGCKETPTKVQVQAP